jgi:hypothetical protein
LAQAPGQAGGGGRVTGFIRGGLGHENFLRGSGSHWRQVGQAKGVTSVGGGSRKQEVGMGVSRRWQGHWLHWRWAGPQEVDVGQQTSLEVG